MVLMLEHNPYITYLGVSTRIGKIYPPRALQKLYLTAPVTSCPHGNATLLITLHFQHHLKNFVLTKISIYTMYSTLYLRRLSYLNHILSLENLQISVLENAVLWPHWYTYALVKGRASHENVFTPLFVSLSFLPFSLVLFLFSTYFFLKSFLSSIQQSIMIFISA